MPLKWQNIRVPFGQGIDTKTDPKQVIPGKLLTLENGVFHETGAIRKRNGFETPYSTDVLDELNGETAALRDGRSIYRHRNELLITAERTSEDNAAAQNVSWEDGFCVFGLDEQKDEWVTLGTREPLRLDVMNVAEPTSQWVIPDVALAENGKYSCFSWLGLADPAAVGVGADQWRHGCVSVFDMDTGTRLLDNYCYDMGALELAHTQGVHVTGIDVPGVSGYFYVWLAVPSTNRIYLSIIPVATPDEPGAIASKSADLHADMIWDATTADHDTHGRCSVLAYKEADDGYINVEWYDWNGTQQVALTINIVCKDVVTVFEAYEWQTPSYKTVVAYQDNADGKIKMTAYNSDNSVFASGTVINRDVGDLANITGCRDPAADRPTAGRSYIRIYVETDELVGGNVAPRDNMVLQGQIEFDGTNGLELAAMYNASLASKAFDHGGKARVWVCHDSWAVMDDDPLTVQRPDKNTYFLRSTQGGGTGNQDEDERTDARLFGGRAHGESFSQSLSAMMEIDTGVYMWAGLRKDIVIEADFGNTFDSVVGVTTTFDQVAQPAVELGPTTQTGGGFVGEVDGAFQETNFHLWPQYMGYLDGMHHTGSDPSTERQYCAIYEWTDREGQIHRSAPSVPATVSSDHGDNSIDIRFTSLSFGDYDRIRNARIVVYRTTDGPGNVFYRLPSTTHQKMDPLTTHIDVYDNGFGNPATADSVLLTRETLYTTGGVLPNVSPPASQIMNVRQDRIFLVPDEDRTAIWYSKYKRYGVAPEFAAEFTLRITDGGPITALITMDTREIVFKENEIRAFSGDGPNDLGIGGFGNDYLITADVGCVDRASVVWTDKGVMFKSHKGIYLLGRNLQVSYIGAPVEDFNQFSVLKAELVETKNQVRFLLDGSQMLVYDYLVDQWSVFKAAQTNPEVETYWDTVDSAMWQNKYVMIQDDGTVHVEGTDYTDGSGNEYIPLTIETAWIKLTGLQGYQRVRWAHFLGEIAGQCVLNIEMYRDYVETVLQTATVTVDAAYTALGGEHQVRVKPVYQKGESYKFRITDSEYTTWGGTQEGYALSEIMLEVGLKKGLHKLRPEKTR